MHRSPVPSERHPHRARVTAIIALLTGLLATGCNTFESLDDHPFQGDTGEAADTGLDVPNDGDDATDTRPGDLVDADADDANDADVDDTNIPTDGDIDLVDTTDTLDTTDDTDTDTDVDVGDPVVTSLSPAAGSAAGGETVRLDGVNLDTLQGHNVDVLLGTTRIEATLSADLTALEFKTEARVAGTVPVTVVLPDESGREIGKFDPGFTFLPAIRSVSPRNAMTVGGRIHVAIDGVDPTDLDANILYVASLNGSQRALLPRSANNDVLEYELTEGGGLPTVVSGEIAVEVHGLRSAPSADALLSIDRLEPVADATVTHFEIDDVAGQITMHGAGFEGLNTSLVTVTLPGAAPTAVLAVDDTSITVDYDSTTRSGIVRIDIDGRPLVESSVPLVLPGANVEPGISAVLPTTATPGSVLVIDGIGLPDVDTRVDIGGASADVLSASDRRVVVVVPQLAAGHHTLEVRQGVTTVVDDTVTVTGTVTLLGGDADVDCPNGPLLSTSIEADFIAARSTSEIFVAQGRCVAIINRSGASISVAGQAVQDGTIRTLYIADEEITAMAAPDTNIDLPLYFATGTRIHALELDGVNAGVVSDVAGHTDPGSSGNNGPAVDARFAHITDLEIDHNGTTDALVVGDEGNLNVRVVNIGTQNHTRWGVTTMPGEVDLVVGNLPPGGVTARAGRQLGLAIDPNGHLYVNAGTDIVRVTAARCARIPGSSTAAGSSADCQGAASADTPTACSLTGKVLSSYITVAHGETGYGEFSQVQEGDIGALDHGLIATNNGSLVVGSRLGLLRYIQADTAGGCVTAHSPIWHIVGDDPSDGHIAGYSALTNAAASNLAMYARPYAIPGSNEVLFADSGRVRLWTGSTDPDAGILTTLAGTGPSVVADDTPVANLPPLQGLAGVVWDETRQQVIFAIDNVVYGYTPTDGTLTRLAGNGITGNVVGGTARTSSLAPIVGLHVAGDDLYILQGELPRLSRVSLTSGTLTEVFANCAPAATPASFAVPAHTACLTLDVAPYGLTTTPSGLVLLSDRLALWAYNPASMSLGLPFGSTSIVTSGQVSPFDFANTSRALAVEDINGALRLYMGLERRLVGRDNANLLLNLSQQRPSDWWPGRMDAAPMSEMIFTGVYDLDYGTRGLYVASANNGLVYLFDDPDGVGAASVGIPLLGTSADRFVAGGSRATTWSTPRVTGFAESPDGLYVVAGGRLLEVTLP